MQRTDIGLYLVTSIGLSVFGIGHTLAIFQAVGKTFLSMQLLIRLTIGEVISSNNGFIQRIGMSSSPLNSRFLFQVRFS